jgi:hypothetical protein
MKKQELIQELIADHELFISSIAQLDAVSFNSAAEGKWSAGQQLEHIRRSVRPFRLAMHLPWWLIRSIGGQLKREHLGYAEVVLKYQAKLAAGAKATPAYRPGVVSFGGREKLVVRVKSEVKGLCALIDRCKEEDLDRYLLPHPILGRLTIREMAYFTLYHVRHHHQQVKAGLSKKL